MIGRAGNVIVDLIIPGEPQGKQRHKWSTHGTYSPKKTVNYETYIKQLFATKYPDFVPVEGALSIHIAAWMTIPASASKKKKAAMMRGEIRPIKRPDVDNIAKVVLDALETLAYKNDAQIVKETTEKWYSDRPCVSIVIREMG